MEDLFQLVPLKAGLLRTFCARHLLGGLVMSLLIADINQSSGQWVQTNGPYGGPIYSLAVSGTNLFAGTSGGVFLSTNNGTSWTAVNTGLTNPSVWSLAMSGTNLFAGTEGGVFLSTNNGTSWSAANTGLTYISVSSLAVKGTNLFAGTLGSSVWRRPLSEMITSVPAEGGSAELPTHFSLEQNYPNPFNPSTTVPFSVPSKSFVSLKVFDVLGREVASLLSQELTAGAYSQRWNAAGFASGVYFYRLSVAPSAPRDLAPTISRDGQAGSFTDTKKLVLLR